MKKLIAIVLTIAMVMGMLTTFGATGTLKDIKEGDWYYNNVNVLVEAGMINGYPDGTFKPNDTMSADQFIKTMVVAMGYTFANGSTYWAQPYISKAIALGIVKSGEFSTYTKAITRADMCRISVRVVENLEGKKTYLYDGLSNSELLASIIDVYTITDIYKQPVSNAYELGILTGYPDGNFEPNKSLTRAEACTVIRRVIDSTIRQPFKLETEIHWETTVIDGWTLPKVNREVIIYALHNESDVEQGYALISLVIILGKIDITLNEQYIAVEQSLISKYNKEVVDQVMNYIKLKTNDEYDLLLKKIDVGDKTIWIFSSPYSGISIKIFKKGTY